MARLESISFGGYRCKVVGANVIWERTSAPCVNGLPQICWTSGQPWREANLWFFERSSDNDRSLKTVQSDAYALHAYAKWLELAQTDWWDFPVRKADRCLVKYRGALIRARDDGALASSTVSARMRVIVAFYRWLQANDLLSTQWPLWRERVVGIRLTDRVGFDRTMTVQTTDLAIANRARHGLRLEDGVTPVSDADRRAILMLAKEHASRELYLILAMGFFTGMRLASICDLKVRTVLNAVPDPGSSEIHYLAIGPGIDPPVATKFGVTGQVIIPVALLNELNDYVYSARRLHREALASSEHRDHVFLTRFGNLYAERGVDKSPSLNVELRRLKLIGEANGLKVRYFRFHQSRATFATSVAEIAVKIGGPINAIALVRDLLLHKDEATSLKYIKFVEQQPVKAQLANDFTREFLGTWITEQMAIDA